jgi:predicted glutamine amidotransferase
MCGHVGIAGNLAYKDEATLKRLLLLDYFRGPDSTGLAAIRKAGEHKIAKVASHPLDLFEMNRFKDALSGHNSKAFIGHNRAATRGVVNSYNAHPYVYDHIIGAHNGTLDSASTKALEDAVGEKFGVDSQAIFAAIAKLGVDAAIPLMEEGKESTTGAWSLVWYDSQQNSMNFLRNKHRPMWYAYSKEFDRIFWASEWAMIENAVRMSVNGYELYRDDKGHRFWQTEADVHYRYDLEALAAGGTERPKPTAKVLKGKEPKQVTTTTYDPLDRGTGSNGPGKTWPIQSSTTKSRGGDGGNNVVELFGDRTSPLAGMISEDTFKRLAKDGCSWCSSPVDFLDVGLTIYESQDLVFCPECSKGRGASTSSRIYVQDMTGIV